MNKILLNLIALILPRLYAKILTEQHAEQRRALHRAEEVKRLLAWPTVPRYDGPKFPEFTK